jgi:hypothetical protein
MIPGDPLSSAIAAGVFALVLLLIARKIRPRSGTNSHRNLVIVINDKALQAMKS